MCVYCCSIKLESRLQTVTTVDCSHCLLTLRYLHYMVTYLLKSRDNGAVDSALTAAVKDKRKT